MGESHELGALGVFPFAAVGSVLAAIITGMVALKVSSDSRSNAQLLTETQRYVADQNRATAEIESGTDMGKILLYAGLGIGGALLLSSLLK